MDSNQHAAPLSHDRISPPEAPRSYFSNSPVVFISFVPSFDSTSESAEKSIGIDFRRPERAVGLGREEPGEDRDREALAERCKTPSVICMCWHS